MGSRDGSAPKFSAFCLQIPSDAAASNVRPVCRVKRFANRSFRASPFGASSSTSSDAFEPPVPSVIPPVCGRWDQGHLAHSYRPQALGALRYGGLPPPVRGPSAPHVDRLSLGGLTFQHSPLAIFRAGMQASLNQNLVPQVQRNPTFHPPMMGPLLQAGASDLLSAVIPSGSSAMTMSSMHDHLKSQHLRQWLLLLDSASSASTLVCSTVDSEFAESHRLKAVAHFAPSTLAAYLRMWRQWEAFAVCHHRRVLMNHHHPWLRTFYMFTPRRVRKV